MALSLCDGEPDALGDIDVVEDALALSVEEVLDVDEADPV